MHMLEPINWIGCPSKVKCIGWNTFGKG